MNVGLNRRLVERAGAVALAAAMVVGAVLLTGLHPDMTIAWAAEAPWWTPLTLVAAYAAAEWFVFAIEYRRQAVIYAMSELPTAMALLYLGVGEAIVAALVASLIVASIRRQVWFKVLFNGCLLAFELSVAYLVFHLAVGSHVQPGNRFVLALLLALVVATLADLLLVSLVVSLFEGGLRQRIGEEVRSVLVVVIVGAVSSTLLACFSLYWPALTALGLLPVVAVWWVVRRNGQTAQQLRDFQALHRLSSSVSRSLHRDEIAQTAVGEVRDILRSDRAAIVLFDSTTGEAAVAAHVGDPLDDLPRRADDPRWHPFLVALSASLLEPAVLASLGIELGAKGGNAILAPVHDDGRLIGVLVMAERSGPAKRFEPNDALRAGAMADRLAAALRNAELHEQIENEAWRDSLTGLDNRTAFERSVAEALMSEGRPTPVSVLMLGIDRFREVNETLGYHVGDSILREMTTRLRATVGEGHRLARVAGDEFAVLVVDDDPEAGERMARRMLGAALDSFRLPDAELVIDVSVGVAECSRGQTDPAALLRRADVAMHYAKQHHTEVEVYRVEIDQRTPERLSLLADLRSALEHCHLDVHFQPKIDLVTGVVVGAEALVRWDHPTRGFVSPIEFVQLAETTGLITELTDQVIGKTTAALRLLNDVGFRLDISLNLSTIDLIDEHLVDRVRSHLEAQQVPADQLTLEITETALLEDGARALATAEALQALGAHLSIDDFGTGFSSLSYLRMLPATELKIDRAFVSKMLDDERDEVIVRSTIDLGHNLGLKVTAEGVEDAATQQRLRELGCDLAQGFGISRPLPLSRFVAWLTTSGQEVARDGIQGSWKPVNRPLDR